jgi:hypothetical protein
MKVIIQNKSGKIPTRGGIRMVPPLDNDLINSRSRSYNDIKSPGEQLAFILSTLARNDEELIHIIKRNQIDINAFGDEPSSGSVTVYNPIRQPILITDIIATWTISTIAPTTLNPIALGASGVATENNNPYSVALTISGGTVTAISIDGVSTGATSGTFYVNPQGSVSVTYSVAPTTFTTAQLTSTLSPVNGTASLKFGGRTFQLNYASGIFLATGMTNGFQMDNNTNNSMTLTVTPATAVHLEFTGDADYRKIERL